MIVDIKLLNPDCKPIKGSDGAIGFDIRANIKEPITIKCGEVKLIPLGFCVDLKEPELGMMLYMRSGLANKHGLMLTNSVGVIDSDYRGEVMASIWNTGTTGKGFTVEPLDTIASSYSSRTKSSSSTLSISKLSYLSKSNRLCSMEHYLTNSI